MRNYRLVRRHTKSGEVRWTVEGSCLACDWPGCEHWVLMPWRWATRDEAEAWVGAVQQRQAVLATMSGVQPRPASTIERKRRAERFQKEGRLNVPHQNDQARVLS